MTFYEDSEEMSAFFDHPEEQPTVSVVIPLYNKGKYIERALSSVFAQTQPPLEIIVVDDGSIDDGPERVLKFNASKIILIQQKNKGPGAARNVGLALAKGEYIAFLDADDEWTPFFLEKGLALLEDKTINASVVSTGFIRYPNKRKNIDEVAELHSGAYEVGAETDVSLVRKLIIFMWTCSTIMKTDVARRWRGFFDQYKCCIGEDTYLFLKLILNEKVAIITEPYAIYHTEASDLYGGGEKRDFTLAPFMIDPSEIFACCPPTKQNILQELLAIKALDEARCFALKGQGEKAKRLLSRFCKNFQADRIHVLGVRLLAELAPILPTVRRLKRYINSAIEWK